eukprot:gene2504-2851_t
MQIFVKTLTGKTITLEKKKKKNYATPKVIKRKPKKIKLAVLKYYKFDENGKIRRILRECPSEGCGAGVFMAQHATPARQYCGRCHTTLVKVAPTN